MTAASTRIRCVGILVLRGYVIAAGARGAPTTSTGPLAGGSWREGNLDGPQFYGEFATARGGSPGLD